MRETKTALFAVLLFCTVEAVAQNAQDVYEAAHAALERGHYATAMRGWQSLQKKIMQGLKRISGTCTKMA